MSEIDLTFHCDANRYTGYTDYMEVFEGHSPTDRQVAFRVEGSSCRLNPQDALQLAIALMDWAREHMPVSDWEMYAYDNGMVEAPGHTDLMITPEEIDEVLAAGDCMCGDYRFTTTDELIDGIGEWR